MTPPPRPGRRPGDPEQTRRAILDAARGVFAARGFDRATIRAIAAEAAVDPALVLHHFGTKRGLFVAAHELPADPAELFARVAEVAPADRGAALARTYLEVFAAPDSAAFSLLRAAAVDTESAAMLREFIEDAVIPAGLPLLREPERSGELRLGLIAGHLLGVAVARQLVGITPLSQRHPDELAAFLGPVIQHYLDDVPDG